MKLATRVTVFVAVAVLLAAALSPVAPAGAIILDSAVILPVIFSFAWRDLTGQNPPARTDRFDPRHLRAPPLRHSA